MSDESNQGGAQPGHTGPVNQPLHHSPVGARISPQVARGVLSTGAIVFEGPGEFVIDFMQRLGSPHSIVARVVLTPMVFAQLIGALQENLRMYQGRFGTPSELPNSFPGEGQENSIEQLYDHLKLSDELASGVYANVVMIGHTPAEYWFDFITNFYPRSSVSSRVYMAAQQVPRFLETLVASYDAHQQKRRKQEE